MEVYSRGPRVYHRGSVSRPVRSDEREPKPLAPLFDSWVEGGLFAAIVLAVAGVALYFDLSVNRVFDVPKALALKTLAGGTTLVWLLVALFGPGVRWRSARVFAAPVAGLLAAVGVSTLFSIDPATSLFGVYERQFGLQGFAACVGIYFVTSTTVAGRRGAALGLVLVALLGGMLGAYAFLQSQGHDPWPFFRAQHNKVYSFLGNATFAGNALAFIFPVSTAVAGIAVTRARREAASTGALAGGLLLGFFAVAFFLVVPGYVAASGLSRNASGSGAQLALRFGFILANGTLLGALALGSYGPGGLRLGSPPQRRFADAVAAGALAACALLILVGIFFARTRGSWVGTGVAIVGALALLPHLFASDPALRKRMRIAGWGGLAVLAVAFSLWVVMSDSLAARTFRSIPAAFDPNRTDFGKGQGTRPYLWGESFRVLTEHDDTLERMYEDEEDLAKVEGPLADELPFEPGAPRTEGGRAFHRAWQNVKVWLFGIGIETYRYAFMSHKSKRLEELDPMTNHDNPHNNYLYVLASFGVVGLLAYLWLLLSLLRQSFSRFLDTSRAESERALAFGVVTSFFSYAVYSIAGFDSVACSVFFYFVLGLCAVLFEPPQGERRASLSAWIVGQWRATRQHGLLGVERARVEPATRAGALPALTAALVLVVGGLFLHTAWSGYRIYHAERAYTGRDSPGRNTLDKRIADIERAIRLHPYESYYKQMLGTTYAQGASQYLQEARRYRQAALQVRDQDPAKTETLLRQSAAFEASAKRYTEKAKIALLAALEHAWAPENIFISLFQALYAAGDDRQAEWALERALRHSPHLGAVRANLAALKLQRGAYEEALGDCRWVLEVDKRSAMAFRTCAKALLELGRLDEAEALLEQAGRAVPKDGGLKALARELKTRRQAETSTT